MRKVITLDCDGVIAEGGFIPKDQRTNPFYNARKPLSIDVFPSLQFLGMMYDIYIVTNRQHEDANLGLRAWLHFGLDVELDTIAGVINVVGSKLPIITALGSVVHFDDHPDHVRDMPGVGVLVQNPGWEENVAACGVLPTVRDWDNIRTFLSSPGMELYGSEGSTVTSPCVEAPTQKIDPALAKALGERFAKL